MISIVVPRHNEAENVEVMVAEIAEATQGFAAREAILVDDGSSDDTAKLIAEQGGKIVVADIKEEAADRVAEETGGTIVSPDAIRSVDCDVYAPCALGGSVSQETIPGIKARVICGAANNQLLEENDGVTLRQNGILYGPDYVVNAGGLISVYNELVPGGYQEERTMSEMEKIYENLKEIFEISKERDICTSKAADLFGDRRIDAARDLVSENA